MPRFDDSLTSRAIAVVVLALCTLVAVAPLVQCEWLPLTDYPQHLAASAFLHRHDDPTWARYLALDPQNRQYLLVYEIIHLLAYPLGLELAGRVTVIGIVATIPWALAFFLHAHGRPPILGALAAAVAINWVLLWGILNFLLGVPLGLLALGFAHRLARGGGGRDALAFFALATLSYYAHPLTYGWMALGCAAQWIVGARSVGMRSALRGLGASVIAALPSVLLFVSWMVASQVLTHGEHRERSGNPPPDPIPVFESPLHSLRTMFERTLDVYVDDAGLRIGFAYVGVVLVLAVLRGVTGGWHRPPNLPVAPVRQDSVGERFRAWMNQRPSPARHSLAPEAVLLMTVALYLLAPNSYAYVSPNERFAWITFLLLAVLGPVSIARVRWHLAIGTGLVVLALVISSVHTRHFHQADEELEGLREVLTHTQPGRRLIGVMYARHGRIIRIPTWWHAHAYYQALVGGLACLNFAELRHSPVVFRPETEPPRWAPEVGRTRDLVSLPGHRAYYDYYLLYHEPHARPAVMPSDGPPLVFANERWALYGWPDGAPVDPSAGALP